VEFEYDLEQKLNEILNPPPPPGQLEEERKAYERSPEGQAELRREKEQRERQYREQEERDREEHPEWYEDERETVVVPATACAEVIPPERGTQSAAPEIISPNFTAKGAVNQTRFAEAMRDVKQRLRSAYALSNRATFFKHARDMLDELEREQQPVAAE
jgi:hypothetical protein